MANNSGNFNIVDQVQSSQLSGGVNAQQVVSTDTSSKPNGAAAIWQNGNLVAGSGVGSTHTEILTDSSGPITSNGDYVYVTGIPD